MQQGLSFLGKAIMKFLTLEIHFSAQFSSNTSFFLDEALLTFQKLENEKNIVLNISFRGVKLEKREGGVFHGLKGSSLFLYVL